MVYCVLKVLHLKYINSTHNVRVIIDLILGIHVMNPLWMYKLNIKFGLQKQTFTFNFVLIGDHTQIT